MTGVHTTMKEVRTEMTFYHHLCRPEPGPSWPPCDNIIIKRGSLEIITKTTLWIIALVTDSGQFQDCSYLPAAVPGVKIHMIHYDL